MARIDDGERLTRSEQNFTFIQNFLNSNSTSAECKLYSSEISRLEKQFPQITITKGKESDSMPHLYNCIVNKK